MVLPTLWVLSYFFFREPVLMVTIGGLADGLLLVGMVFAVWKLRTRDVPKRFRKSPLWSPALVVSSLAIATVGLVNIIEILGSTPG